MNRERGGLDGVWGSELVLVAVVAVVLVGMMSDDGGG